MRNPTRYAVAGSVALVLALGGTACADDDEPVGDADVERTDEGDEGVNDLDADEGPTLQEGGDDGLLPGADTPDRSIPVDDEIQDDSLGGPPLPGDDDLDATEEVGGLEEQP